MYLPVFSLSLWFIFGFNQERTEIDQLQLDLRYLIYIFLALALLSLNELGGLVVFEESFFFLFLLLLR